MLELSVFVVVVDYWHGGGSSEVRQEEEKEQDSRTHGGYLTDVISTLDAEATPALYKVDCLFLPAAAY